MSFAKEKVTEDKPVEMTEEQRACICYKSNLLGKYFDSYSELEKAEEEYRAKDLEKKRAQDERKTDVDRVKAAITKNFEARKEAQKIRTEGYKAYMKSLDAAAEIEKDGEEEERKALTDFCTKYKDGFHETITIDNLNYRYDYSESKAVDHFGALNSLLNHFYLL